MVTQSRAKELFHYDEKTGLFTRLKDVARRPESKSGHVLSGSQSNGYMRVMVDGESILLHRLALIYMGIEISGQVDHIDGDRRNNRISNLRVVSHQENGRNVKIPSNNKSGVIGVCWDSLNGKWYAQIKSGGKNIFLGRFDNLSDAKNARLNAESKYGFHVNHGKR